MPLPRPQLHGPVHSGGRASIMAVDDQPANLRLLEDLLGHQGYAVRSFPCGRLALEAAQRNPPDLFLLDINMPEMNGFQMCACLKSDERLSPIPVIFLSALTDASDKVRAFQCGGVDYITKPFQVDEVQARVRTHLQIHRLQKELVQYTDHLEELVAARTFELAETQARLKLLDSAKSDFLRLIHHEFRSPLNGLLGAGELALDGLAPGEEGDELRQMFDESRTRILSILEDALLLTEIEVATESFSSERIELMSVLGDAVCGAKRLAAVRGVGVDMGSGGPGFVRGQRCLLLRAFQNLVEAAVKFSKPDDTVVVSAEKAAVCIRGGGHIPEEALGRFFDVFAIGEAITPGGDLGLGPAVSQRILALFGGSVEVENLAPSGIQFSVTLTAD